MLRDSSREPGKVKHRTIANLSQGSEAEIAAIRLALRHKPPWPKLGSVQDLNALGFAAAAELNPSKARVLTRLALLHTQAQVRGEMKQIKQITY